MKNNTELIWRLKQKAKKLREDRQAKKEQDEKQRKRKRLLDGRQKEKRRKTKTKSTHTNTEMRDYFQSILAHRAKRRRRTLDIEQIECSSMNLDTET